MSEQIFLQGQAGQIEVFVDYPQGEVKGFAVLVSVVLAKVLVYMMKVTAKPLITYK